MLSLACSVTGRYPAGSCWLVLKAYLLLSALLISSAAFTTSIVSSSVACSLAVVTLFGSPTRPGVANSAFAKPLWTPGEPQTHLPCPRGS